MPCYDGGEKEEVSMSTTGPKRKLNAQRSLIVTASLYLVNAGVGTMIAVKENLPSVTFITSGKPALEDFLTGNGTALSPPLYLCVIAILVLILACQPKRPGTLGIVGLTILGLLFLLGECSERLTYQVLDPVTFDLPVALVKLVAIVLALLIMVFGGVEIVRRRQALVTRRGGSGGDEGRGPLWPPAVGSLTP
jgi:hypothetical protein